MTKLSLSTAAVVFAVATTACSDSMTRDSLTGPSPTSSAITADGSAVNSVSSDRSPGTALNAQVLEWAGVHPGWSAAGFEVEGTAPITAVTGLCPSRTITVLGVPVVLNAATTYSGGASCESLAAGMTVTVRALLEVTPTGFVVTATNISRRGPGGGDDDDDDGDDDDGDDDDDDGEGGGGGTGKKVSGDVTVGDVRGTCPSLTLLIQGARVRTNSLTLYVGGTCASLREGTKIKIDAEVMTDGSYVAERIEIEKVPGGGGGGRPVAGDGKVDAVTGLCPSITMTVKGFNVSTNAATVFSGGTCQSIVPGTHVDVTATADAMGVVVASSVAIKNPGKK